METALTKHDTPQHVFAEQLALYARLGFVYPETNARVVHAGATLTRLVHEFGSPVTVRFDGRGTHVFVGDVKIPVAGHHVPWLRDCLARTLLSGLSIPIDADASHFWAFVLRLRENQHRTGRGTTFETLWVSGEPLDAQTIKPIELRFGRGEIAESGDEATGLPMAGGDNLSPVEQVRLARLLSTSPQIGELLTGIQMMLGAGDSDASILDEIVRVLPVDIAQDPERMHQVVNDTLTKLRETLKNQDGSPQSVRSRAAHPQTAPEAGADLESSIARIESQDLRKMIHALALRFFRAGPIRHEGNQPITMPRGHEGDDLIRDDVEALETEFAELPQSVIVSDEVVGDFSLELLGIVLHALARTPEGHLQARLRHQLRRLLAGSEPRLVDLVVSYIEPMFDSESQRDREALTGAERVLEAVRLADLLPILRHTPLLDVEHVVAAFPRTFVLFLDSIPPEDPDALAMIAEVCARVGTSRLAAARPELSGEQGLVTNERIARLLATPSPDALPLLPALLGSGSGDLLSTRLESIAQYVRRCTLPPRDTAVFRLVDPLSRIPLRYVVDFCNEGGRLRGRLIDQSSTLLRDFVMATRGEPQVSARRLSAIRVLGEFDSPATRAFLQQLESDRFGPLKLRREPKAVRSAAEAALAAFDHHPESVGKTATGESGDARVPVAEQERKAA